MLKTKWENKEQQNCVCELISTGSATAQLLLSPTFFFFLFFPVSLPFSKSKHVCVELNYNHSLYAQAKTTHKPAFVHFLLLFSLDFSFLFSLFLLPARRIPLPQLFSHASHPAFPRYF